MRFKLIPIISGALVGMFVLLGASSASAVTVRPAQPDYESPVRSGGVDLIVIHTMESPESWSADENVCAYLARIRSASVNWCVDGDSATPSVPENRVAWTASHPYVNNRALQFELAGYAAQDSAEWADDYSQSELRNTAEIAARMVREHGIPIRKLTTDEMCRGMRGFIGHADVRGPCASNSDNHWDPGPNFPWSSFLTLVSLYAGSPGANVPVPAPWTAPAANNTQAGGRNLTNTPTQSIQKVVGVTPDGDYGPATTAAVQTWQRKLGVDADGVWGNDTQRATDNFFRWIASVPAPAANPVIALGSKGNDVADAQRALNRYGANLTVDGVFGPATQAAVIRCQRWFGLTQDGVIGPNTWHALGR